MLKFPLSAKEIRQEDYVKVKDIKSGIATIMKLRNTNKLFVFQNLTEIKDRKEFAEMLQKNYYIYHPSILHLSGYIISPHRIISTIYLKNGSLNQYFNNNDKDIDLSQTNKSMIIFGIAIAFEYLHTLNIIQSPFSPSDIFLSDELYPLVQLYGITQKNRRSTNNNNRFFAPEYLSEEKYSEKADSYTLGVILFELSTSEQFQNTESLQKFKLPKLTNSIIAECCSKNPDSRPSFKEIVNQIKNSNDQLFNGEDKSTISKFQDRIVEYQKMSNFNLSKRYRYGKDLPQDLEKAAFLMKKAADEDNDTKAQFSYGKMLSNEIGVEKNIEESRKYLEISAKSGYKKAKDQLEVLDRREELEWPINFQSSLFNLTSSSHRSTVQMIVNSDDDKQTIAAYNFFTLLKIKPTYMPKYVRVVSDVCKQCPNFNELILDVAFSNLNPYSIVFIYRLFQNGIFTIENFLRRLTEKELDDFDLFILILHWFGPEIQEADPRYFDEMLQNTEFDYKESEIKRNRSIKHPINPILQIIRHDNPSEFKSLTPDKFDFTISLDFYDPISITLKGQTPADYAAFLACYHIFPHIVKRSDFSPSLMKNAIHGGSIEILNHLKEMHADFTDSLKNSVLFHQQNIFDWILRNKLDSWSEDLILYASASNYAKFLIDYKCNPHYKDKNGNNAMHFAALYGSVDFLRLLFEICDDLDINEPNDKGIYFLFFI